MKFFRSALLGLLLCLVASTSTIAQDSTLDRHYPGGQEQFWNDFKQHFQFPLSAVKAQIYGTSLIKLTLNSDGVPAKILFLNQIDRDIIKSITRSFTKISENWSAFPSETELYIGISFSYNQNYMQDLDIDKSIISKEVTEFTYIIETEEPGGINYKKNYSQLVKEAKKAYKKSDFAAAKQAYTRLISINPYQLDYYQKRVELEAFSGSKKYACTDIKVMKDMLNYTGSILLHGCN